MLRIELDLYTSIDYERRATNLISGSNVWSLQFRVLHVSVLPYNTVGRTCSLVIFKRRHVGPRSDLDRGPAGIVALSLLLQRASQRYRLSRDALRLYCR